MFPEATHFEMPWGCPIFKNYERGQPTYFKLWIYGLSFIFNLHFSLDHGEEKDILLYLAQVYFS